MGEAAEISSLLNLHPFEQVLDFRGVGKPSSSNSSARLNLPGVLLHQFSVDSNNRQKKSATRHSPIGSDSRRGSEHEKPAGLKRPRVWKHLSHLANTKALQKQCTASPQKTVVALGSADPFDVLPSFASRILGSTSELLVDFHDRYGRFYSSTMWSDAMFQSRAALLSFLYISVTATKMSKGGGNSVFTLAARQEAVGSLSVALQKSSALPSNEVLMSLDLLITSEMCYAPKSTIEMHLKGCAQAVSLRGGFSVLDRMGGLEHECASRLQYSNLIAYVLHELPPPPDTMSYIATPAPIMNDLPESAMESPIYHNDESPLVPPESIKTVPSQVLWILFGQRMMTDLLLEQCDLAEFGYADSEPKHRLHDEGMRSIYYDLLSQPSMEDLGPKSPGILLYEAIRLTALIYSTAIICNVPLSKAMNMPPLRRREPHIKQKTLDIVKQISDQSKINDFLGVALWQMSVCSAAIGPVEFVTYTCLDPVTNTFKPMLLKFFEAFYSRHHLAITRSLKTLCRINSALARKDMDFKFMIDPDLDLGDLTPWFADCRGTEGAKATCTTQDTSDESAES